MTQDSENKNKKTENKSPWNMELAAIIIQMVLGGGLGTGITALNSSDLPKLALGGAIGGVGAPLVVAFTDPITKKLKKGAGAGGEAFAKGGENLFQKWRTSLSPFESKYMEALRAYCYALEVEGFRADLPALALKDVYIPLRLNMDRGNVYGQAKIDTKIWDFLPKANTELNGDARKLAIVADPGYGKTTLTRYLTLSYSCPTYEEKGMAKLLPVLLKFREIHKIVQTKQSPTLEDLIVQQILGLPRCQELPITPAWLKDELKKGHCLVMLDGLDEVPDQRRDVLSQWANYQMQNYASIFILTSRPHGYDSSLFSGVRQLDILKFDQKQKRTFLKNWYRVVMWEQTYFKLLQRSQQEPNGSPLSEEQAKAQSEDEAEKAAQHLYQQIAASQAINQQLAVNPLLLTIIAATHNAFDALPERRVNLYRKMFGLLLEDRPNRRETRLTLKEAEQNQAVLQLLALKLMEAGETQFDQDTGSRWIRTRLNEQENDQNLPPKKFLAEIEQVAGLLTGGDSNLYQFAHKTFQEYLVAVELTKKSNLPLLERLRSPEWKPVEDWQEVFSFYAALTSADFLVDEVAKLSDGHKRQKTLELLHRIVKEEKSKITASDKRQLLEDLLKEATFTSETAAKITLEQRFQDMIRLDDRTEITAQPITWGEYQQFLEAQNTGQFHSTAQVQTIPADQLNHPVQGVSKTDQTWFCAWLSIQTSLQVEDVLFDYRLPKPEELEKGGLSTNDQFYILRKTISSKYSRLVNYLASASWREADEETYQLMINMAGKEEGQWLDADDFMTIFHEDLSTLDKLWLKYSNGKWGFTIQQRIWEDHCIAGSNKNNETLMGDLVGWRKNGGWLRYDQVTFDLHNSLPGELPCRMGRLLRYKFKDMDTLVNTLRAHQEEATLADAIDKFIN